MCLKTSRSGLSQNKVSDWPHYTTVLYLSCGPVRLCRLTGGHFCLTAELLPPVVWLRQYLKLCFTCSSVSYMIMIPVLSTSVWVLRPENLRWYLHHHVTRVDKARNEQFKATAKVQQSWAEERRWRWWTEDDEDGAAGGRIEPLHNESIWSSNHDSHVH